MKPVDPSVLRAALANARVNHFAVHEVLYPGANHFTGPVKNSLPPADLLPNLVAVAKLADRVRDRFAGPLHILSGYRSAAYNRSIKGAPGSYHLRGMALDLSPLDQDRIGDLLVIAVRMWNSGELQGGLGLYRWGIHIDVGPKRTWQL